MTWHVTEDLWRSYSAGAIDPVLADAVDAHAQRCAECQSAARGYVDPVAVEQVWRDLSAELAAPRMPRILRWLPDRDAVPIAASMIGLPWAVAVGTAVVAAILTGLTPSRSVEIFLLIAPLIPVLAVVAAFDAGDPLRELIASTPYSKLRLALLRASAAIAVAVPVTGAVGWLVPPLAPVGLVWLLPALALTSLTLLLLTWLSARVAGTLVAGCWALIVVALGGWFSTAVLAELAVQLGFVVVAAVAGALFVLRSATTNLKGGF